MKTTLQQLPPWYILLALLCFALPMNAKTGTHLLSSTTSTGLVKQANDHPQTVYPLTKQLQTYDWYIVQSDLWQGIIYENPQHEEAWMNYYTANRMMQLLRPSVVAQDLDAIVARMANKIPETYAYHYVKYWNGAHGQNLFDHLKKAYQINEHRTDTYRQFIAYYEQNQDAENKGIFCKKWFDSNDLSAGILAWNYNVLMSLDKDAVIVTQGENDTYPIWVLQQVQEVRPDVQVLNLELLRNTTYRQNIFAKLNIPAFAKSEDTYDDVLAYQSALCAHLVKNAPTSSIHFGVAIDPNIQQDFEQNLYLTGLAFKHSAQAFDNTQALVSNYENRFLTDYLKIDFQQDVSASVVNQMNLSYIPPFLMLYDHYRKESAMEKAEVVKDLALQVAEKGGRKADVEAYLNKDEEANFQSRVVVNIKKLDDRMKPIRGNLHASEVEVSNAQYELFLLDLMRSRQNDMLQICQPDPVEWRGFLDENYKNEPDAVIYVHGHPDGARNPILNISYEAAQAYCDWLTKVYNKSDYKKKAYKKVKFRLPTVEEWEYAASSGKTNRKYPWGGPDIQNAKGCYLQNIKTVEGANEDGGVFTVRGDAYFPNDFGLYQTIGNVAEMTQTKGLAKGGSWNHTPENSRIKDQQSYEGKDPAVGFRVFMEVVQ